MENPVWAGEETSGAAVVPPIWWGGEGREDVAQDGRIQRHAAAEAQTLSGAKLELWENRFG